MKASSSAVTWCFLGAQREDPHGVRAGFQPCRARSRMSRGRGAHRGVGEALVDDRSAPQQLPRTVASKRWPHRERVTSACREGLTCGGGTRSARGRASTVGESGRSRCGRGPAAQRSTGQGKRMGSSSRGRRPPGGPDPARRRADPFGVLGGTRSPRGPTGWNADAVVRHGQVERSTPTQCDVVVRTAGGAPSWQGPGLTRSRRVVAATGHAGTSHSR